MMRQTGAFIGGLRYLFAIAAIALAILAVGSLVMGVVQLIQLAVSGGFFMEPSGGAAVVPHFIGGAFLYFLAVAFWSLFVTDVPSPQWMTVKNLFQFRTKILAFVSIILPLGFMGKMMEADTMTPGTLYTGAGVFLVLLGIFFLTRYGSPSGDEGMVREGTRPAEVKPKGDRRERPGDSRSRADRFRKTDKRQAGENRSDQDAWLQKQKEDLKFQKESLEKAVEKDISGESRQRPGGHVTVRPGPRRPKGRR
ncbi:MAG: hypothetical protein PVJ01_00710 [Pseudomonadota bacterium]|jgi:uncharacterized membrane protein YqhA